MNKELLKFIIGTIVFCVLIRILKITNNYNEICFFATAITTLAVTTFNYAIDDKKAKQ